MNARARAGARREGAPDHNVDLAVEPGEGRGRPHVSDVTFYNRNDALPARRDHTQGPQPAGGDHGDGRERGTGRVNGGWQGERKKGGESEWGGERVARNAWLRKVGKRTKFINGKNHRLAEHGCLSGSSNPLHLEGVHRYNTSPRAPSRSTTRGPLACRDP